MRALAPDAAVVVGMSLGGLTALALADRAPDLVPRLVLVDVTPGVNREKSSAIAQFIDGPEYFERRSTRSSTAPSTFNPTRSVSSLRRGILHNAIEAPDGRWRWRYDLPRRGSGEGDEGRSCPASTSCGTRCRARAGAVVVGARQPLAGGRRRRRRRGAAPTTRGAVIVVVEGAGHSVQGDKPLELARDSRGHALRSMLPELAVRRSSTTRDALHALAEQVVAAAYFHATATSGLRPTPRGFGTPVFGDGERVRVDGVGARARARRARARGCEITTLGATRRASSASRSVHADRVHAGDARSIPTRRSRVDHDAALALGDWYRARRRAAATTCATVHADEPSTESQIWPEHFDLACEIGDADAGTRANYGASPGDGAIPQPYLYVGPWDAARRTGHARRLPVRARR